LTAAAVVGQMPLVVVLPVVVVLAVILKALTQCL
jgi:hypothetical protein